MTGVTMTLTSIFLGVVSFFMGLMVTILSLLTGRTPARGDE